LPWNSELEKISELETSTKVQYRLVVEKQIRDPTSPFYIHPPIYPETDSGFFYNHPHTDLVENELDLDRGGINPNSTIQEASRLQNKRDLQQQKQLEQLSQNVNQSVFDAVDLSQESREAARTEIFLRTSESPKDREIPDLDSVPETPENIDQQVKDLVHHFAMETVREEDDGIVPLH
ncbi:MAG: SAM-dependent methyltransferase, partial [Halobacteriaceae archaeon]